MSFYVRTVTLRFSKGEIMLREQHDITIFNVMTLLLTELFYTFTFFQLPLLNKITVVMVTHISVVRIVTKTPVGPHFKTIANK